MGVLRSTVGITLILWPERFLRLSGREAPTGAAICFSAPWGYGTWPSDSVG